MVVQEGALGCGLGFLGSGVDSLDAHATANKISISGHVWPVGDARRPFPQEIYPMNAIAPMRYSDLPNRTYILSRPKPIDAADGCNVFPASTADVDHH